MKIFSIKNEKLGFFNRPIYCESEAEALSYIQNVLMSDSDRALSNLKDDLSLYCLGYIDFENGIIVPVGADGCDTNVQPRPFMVCSLREIFDTIPEEKLKPSITRSDLDHVLKLVQDLDDSFSHKIKCVNDDLVLLDRKKKGARLYDIV